MEIPGHHPQEAQRQSTIAELGLLMGDEIEGAQPLVQLLARALAMPVALFTVADEDQLFFRARVGLSTERVARDISFCAHSLLHGSEPFVVNNLSEDPRFAHNLTVHSAPHYRFYAGISVLAPNKLPVGTLCVLDYTARSLTDADLAHLYQAKSLMESLLALRAQSMRDHLTGLYNRRTLDSQLEREWRRARRSRKPIAVLVLDIDYFKRFNDYFGHQAGDDCLRTVANTLQGALNRGGDLLARFGGEEFVALTPDISPEDALNAAEKIRTAVARLRIPHPSSPQGYVTLSIGVGLATTASELEQHVSCLFAAGDHALYSAKNAGRNTVVVQHVETTPLQLRPS